VTSVLLLAGILIAAALIGLLFGGSLRALGELSFRWWGLALLGLALQFVPVRSRGWAAALLVASYAVLTLFVVANIRMPGMPLIALGFVLNIVAIAANGGMPVSDQALRVAFGNGYAEQRRELVTGHGGAKHHLRSEDDVLIFLADVVPVPAPLRIVVSVGDLLALVGAGWVVIAATTGHAVDWAEVGGGKHRRRYVKRATERGSAR
jgi:hypothetical protein